MNSHWDDQVLIRRALTAYLRVGTVHLVDDPIPSLSSSGVVMVDRLLYVLVRGRDGELLAVYRVRTSGILKRLRRWPASLV